MRNVMVRCLFSVLILVLSHALGILGQERHVLQWSDQQVLADDWQPFVPNFAAERPYQQYPRADEHSYQQYPRSDTVRQFFGKNVEAVHNSLKKSFQTSAANNIDQYVVPPVLNSFSNGFGLQGIHTRPAILDKNIKDSQFLDQTSHFPIKFQHQPLQQSNQQQTHRFPAYVPPPGSQYQTISQYQPYQNQNQFANRYENSAVKSQILLPAPARTISTSVQVFPPNQQNRFSTDSLFAVPPPKTENYAADDQPLTQKQTRPNDFLLGNNIPTIYGSKDPTLNIAPPALKTVPFVRPEIQNHFLYEPIKGLPERFEIINYQKPALEVQAIKQTHFIEQKQPVEEQANPSKQVYEQLSHYGRPFTLPKESATEFSRLKPQKNIESEGLINSYTPPLISNYHHQHHHRNQGKKEKAKPTHHYMPLKNIGRTPVNNILSDINQPNTSENLLIDYEPGKLQSVKTVTYMPEREVIHFNEGDVSGHPYQTSEKIIDATPDPFLPTPTNSQDNGPVFIHFDKYTTPSQEIISKLPQNHKYSGSRNRFQSSHTSESSIQFINDYRQPTSVQPNILNTDNFYQNFETSTQKSKIRRRKPSKNKNKDYNRQKVTAHTEATSTVDTYATQDLSTEANYPSTRKKLPTKLTTTEAAIVEDNYPNYPDFSNFNKVKQQLNYPKEYQQYDQHNSPSLPQQQTQYIQENNNNVSEERENYPIFSLPITTHLPETTTSSLPVTIPSTSSARPRIKSKYGNSTRPRFSIKDYKRTTTTSPLTTISPSTTTTDIPNNDFESEKKINRKNLFALRVKNRTELPTSSTEKEESVSEITRKYKLRTRPSKYKISTTTVTPETTSERVNTFKPSTIARYRPSTNKYFNRIRTTTEIINNEAEDAATSASDKKPIRTMLYSAKRSSILKPKSTTTVSPKVEYDDDEEYEENEADEAVSPVTSSIKKKTYSRFKTAASSKLEKADDGSETDIMTSSEEENEKEKLKSKDITGSNAASQSQDILYNAGDSAAEDSAALTQEEGEELNDEDVILDIRDQNEATTIQSSNSSILPQKAASNAEERIDDDDEGDKVSKVSSLTSIIDETKLPASFYRKWSRTGNQNE